MHKILRLSWNLGEEKGRQRNWKKNHSLHFFYILKKNTMETLFIYIAFLGWKWVIFEKKITPYFFLLFSFLYFFFQKIEHTINCALVVLFIHTLRKITEILQELWKNIREFENGFLNFFFFRPVISICLTAKMSSAMMFYTLFTFLSMIRYWLSLHKSISHSKVRVSEGAAFLIVASFHKNSTA